MRIGIKCICASILHAGHINCLRECKNQCNYLIVLTQTDNIIKHLKGAKPPIPLQERIIILDSIKFVDEVAVYEESTEDEWLHEFVEDILPRRFPRDAKLIMFHSDELRGKKELPGKDVVDEIIFIPRRYISTSELIEKIIRNKEWKKK
jgi:cytidyltransferase-like protein